jgi:hypothetical protein
MASLKLLFFDGVSSKQTFGRSPRLFSPLHGSETKNSSQFLWCLAAFFAAGEGFVSRRSCQAKWYSPNDIDVLGTDWKSGGPGANYEAGENLQGFRSKAAACGKTPLRMPDVGLQNSFV